MGNGSGKRRCEAYDDLAKEICTTYRGYFCIAMLKNILSCSNKYLYGTRVDPKHLGGKFNHENMNRKTTPRLEPIIKKYGSTLMSLDDLVDFNCCKQVCGSTISRNILEQHRNHYRTGRQADHSETMKYLLHANKACCTVFIIALLGCSSKTIAAHRKNENLYADFQHGNKGKALTSFSLSFSLSLSLSPSLSLSLFSLLFHSFLFLIRFSF